jgi:5-methylcytosine-specific restriction protein A
MSRESRPDVSVDRRGSSAARGYGYKWQKAREQFLAQPENALCVMCTEAGVVEPATIVDHRTPHRGDMKLFWDRKNWQGVCEPHHNRFKQALEKSGIVKGNDISGRPTDPAHLWNRS